MRSKPKLPPTQTPPELIFRHKQTTCNKRERDNLSLSRLFARTAFHTIAATSHTRPIPAAPIIVYTAGVRSRHALLNFP